MHTSPQATVPFGQQSPVLHSWYVTGRRADPCVESKVSGSASTAFTAGLSKGVRYGEMNGGIWLKSRSERSFAGRDLLGAVIDRCRRRLPLEGVARASFAVSAAVT